MWATSTDRFGCEGHADSLPDSRARVAHLAQCNSNRPGGRPHCCRSRARVPLVAARSQAAKRGSAATMPPPTLPKVVRDRLLRHRGCRESIDAQHLQTGTGLDECRSTRISRRHQGFSGVAESASSQGSSAGRPIEVVNEEAADESFVSSALGKFIQRVAAGAFEVRIGADVGTGSPIARSTISCQDQNQPLVQRSAVHRVDRGAVGTGVASLRIARSSYGKR